jgi:L-histidine N-alpha-methyltransferase
VDRDAPARDRAPARGIADLDLDIEFANSEELRTEISAKFTPERLAADLRDPGLTLVELYTDPEELFAVSLVRARR